MPSQRILAMNRKDRTRLCHQTESGGSTCIQPALTASLRRKRQDDPEEISLKRIRPTELHARFALQPGKSFPCHCRDRDFAGVLRMLQLVLPSAGDHVAEFTDRV